MYVIQVIVRDSPFYVYFNQNRVIEWLSMRVLVIEDNPLTAKTLVEGLKPSYVVETANRIHVALQKITNNPYDIILLDVLLPDGNGIEFCKVIRKSHPTLPILMLSAKDAVCNKIEAFHAGADEYMTKPFSFEELFARMKLISQRKNTKAPLIPIILNISIDYQQRRALRDGKDMKLNKKEFDILEILVENRGKILTRGVIMEKIWSSNTNISFNTIDAHIKNLRKKLYSKDHPNMIETIRGVGYTISDSL